jgi:hypothetical protein
MVLKMLVWIRRVTSCGGGGGGGGGSTGMKA